MSKIQSKCEICQNIEYFEDILEIPKILIPENLIKYQTPKMNEITVCRNCFQEFKQFKLKSEDKYIKFMKTKYKFLNTLKEWKNKDNV